MRQIYVEDDTLALSEYIDALDTADFYRCWQDAGTQEGYNYRRADTLEDFRENGIRARFMAAIVRKSDGACVGIFFVSPEGGPADLAIMIYPAYRGRGYAVQAFSLGTRYCFEALGLPRVYAGCYPGNPASQRMLDACGFVPHPEGNQPDTHYLTGEAIIQMDFVKENPGRIK